MFAMTPNETQAQRLPIRILALDGGGVRGLASLLVLREVMQRLQVKSGSRTPVRPSEYFDLIIGTGTGGISAIFLGRMRMTVDGAIEAYMQVAEKAFQPSATNHPGIYRMLDGHVFESAFARIVDQHLGHSGVRFADPPDATTTSCRTAVLAAASASVDAPPFIFRSYTTSVPPSPFTICQVARATVSTAGVFAPVSLGSPPIQFINAALAGYDNPAEVGVNEAASLWPGRTDCLVSLGTGRQRIISFNGGWNQMAEACRALVQSCERVHDRVHRTRQRYDLPYFRINVDWGLDTIDVMEWKEAGPEGCLAGITDAYLRLSQIEILLDSCVSMLNGEMLGIHSVRVVPRLDSQALEDAGFQAFARRDVKLVRKLSSRPFQPMNRNTLSATLHEAQWCKDGQVVLVRTYEGSDPSRRAREFSRDLSVYTNIWVSVVLQLIGASASTISIPFQVYHAPDGRVENFKDWVIRTTASNPVEAICGLYNMRTSLKVRLLDCGEMLTKLGASQGLREFETDRGVQCIQPLYYSLVNVRTNGSQVEWALIYAGEIRHGHNSWAIHDEYRDGFPWGRTPSRRMVTAFSRGGEGWAEGAPNLDAIFSGGIQNLDMTTLGSVLFENGCLGAATDYPPPSTIVALGDVGYTTEEGRFVVVSSLHSFLTSADGDALTWNCNAMHHPEDVLSVEFLDKAYRRYEHRQCSSYSYRLGYTDLNERHAWKVLQDHACKIIACHGLTVNPDDMKLVVCVDHWGEFDAYYPDLEDLANEYDAESTLAEDTLGGQPPPVETYSDDSMDVDQLRIQSSNNAVAPPDIGMDSDTDTSGQRSSTSPIHTSSCPQDVNEHSPPLYYVFAGDAPKIRDLGVPELPPCPRASFQALPEWLVLDEPFRVEDDAEPEIWRRVEADGKYELLEERGCYLCYLQLPLGVALPFVEEMVES